MRSAFYRLILLPALQRIALGVAFATGAMPTRQGVVRLERKPATTPRPATGAATPERDRRVA